MISGVYAALLGRAQDGRQDLLRLSAVRCAIAAAAHFARDDGRAEGVFGAPISRVERGIEEEAENGREFGPQMDGEAACVGEAAYRPIDDAES